MTFDEIWQQLTRKKPELDQDLSVVEFTAGNFRRLLRQVYEQGEASVPRETTILDAGNPFPDIFGGKHGG